MNLWHQPPSLDQINRSHAGTAVSQLGIEFTDIGASHLAARMPVDARTRQPAGLLHGGATMLLSPKPSPVTPPGRPSTAPRPTRWALRSTPTTCARRGDGWVHGRVTAIHAGRSTQIWEVRVTDDKERLVSIARVTISLIAKA